MGTVFFFRMMFRGNREDAQILCLWFFFDVVVALWDNNVSQKFIALASFFLLTDGIVVKNNKIVVDVLIR